MGTDTMTDGPNGTSTGVITRREHVTARLKSGRRFGHNWGYGGFSNHQENTSSSAVAARIAGRG